MKYLLLAFITFSGIACSQHPVQETGQNRLLKDVAYLASDELKGRDVGEAGNKVAAEYIKQRFKDLGLEPFGNSFSREFSFSDRNEKKYNAANIIGYVQGNSKNAKYIVITAHYDHVGVHDGKIYNGADDNASGVAALMSMAEYISKNQPQNHIIFAALDAEEKGLQGAKAFVENPPIPKEKIALNLNMDMVSRSDKNEIFACGTAHYPFLKSPISKVDTGSLVKVIFGHDGLDGKDDWTYSSDHSPFHNAGIPFIYFGVEDHKDYHKPTDDFENIDPEFFIEVVEYLKRVVKTLDDHVPFS